MPCKYGSAALDPQKLTGTAEALMRFINTRKENGPRGSVYWSLRDGNEYHKEYYDEICMYAGAAGILCFLLTLYDVTGKQEYLEEAGSAARYLEWRWDNDRSLKRNFSQYAFSSGWSGAGYALLQYRRVTGDKRAEETADAIVRQAIKDAVPSPDGVGCTWSDYPGIVGNAGTILFILYAAGEFGKEEYRSFAIGAGRVYLNKAHDAGNGRIYYLGVNPGYFGAGDDYVDPNFPMGTAGIGFTLLRLYEESGDQAFLDGVKGVHEYMASVAVPAGAAGGNRFARLLPHGLPANPGLFYLGYCHGPAGTCRFYYKLWKMTGDNVYQEWIDRLVHGLLGTGAPEKRSPGYWNTYNICCGTAGLLNLFLGLWAEDGGTETFDAAMRCGKVLMDAIKYEDPGDGSCEPVASVPFALDRIAPDAITTPIGLFDGAAGIGTMLVQLALAIEGRFHAVRAIDDPFPERCRSLGQMG